MKQPPKQVYRESNNGPLYTPHDSRPVRASRDSRDEDQGLHLRLASGCSLDSAKANHFPQQRGLPRAAPKGHGSSSRRHVSGASSSRDGAPVSDVSNHRPAPPHSHRPAGRPASYHNDRPPAGHSSRSRSSYGPTGPHAAQLTGGFIPADGLPAAAGGPSGAAAMALPVRGSARGGLRQPVFSCPGPYDAYGQPLMQQPPYTYGARGAFYDAAPGAVPYGPGGAMQAGPGPAAVAGGYAGNVYGMRPPPPPPRQLAPQPAQLHASNDSNPAVLHGPPQALQPGAAGGPPTPFAVAERGNATDAAAVAPAACPRNEFAERLAQRAMASAARAKSSLLAGAGSSSLSRGDSFSAAAVRAVDIPAAVLSDSGGSCPAEQQGGVCVKPLHPFGRPKPRSAPLDGPPAVSSSGNYSSTSSDSGDAPVDHCSGSVASSVSSGVTRPRLHLLPRGSSSSSSSASGASSATAASAPRKPSVFGEAKPREEVLRQRGLDPALMDAAGAAELRRKQTDTSMSASRSRISSRDSGAEREEEWHTVAGRRGAAAAAVQREGRDGRVAFDPFFGSNSDPAAVVVLPPARSASGRDSMKHSGARGGGGFAAPDRGADDEDDDGCLFKRALPTRQLPFAI